MKEPFKAKSGTGCNCMLQVLHCPSAFLNVFYETASNNQDFQYIMHEDCSSKRTCGNLLIELEILRLRQPRDIYHSDSTILGYIRQLRALMKLLIAPDQVCPLCRNTVLLDQTYCQSLQILAGLIDADEIGIGLRNARIVRFENLCEAVIIRINGSQGCFNKPIILDAS